MKNGFVKLHRSILDSTLYENRNAFNVFIHIILNCNYKESVMCMNNKDILIPSGSFVTSLSKLGGTLNIGIKAIRGTLDYLKRTNRVTCKTTNRFTIIQVQNWNKYQSEVTQKDTQKDTQIKKEGQSEGKQRATSKEYKEYNNLKEQQAATKEKAAAAQIKKPIKKEIPVDVLRDIETLSNLKGEKPEIFKRILKSQYYEDPINSPHGFKFEIKEYHEIEQRKKDKIKLTREAVQRDIDKQNREREETLKKIKNKNKKFLKEFSSLTSQDKKEIQNEAVIKTTEKHSPGSKNYNEALKNNIINIMNKRKFKNIINIAGV